MLNDRSTPLSLLRTRRSGRPRDLVAPGPDADALRTMLEIGCRTPDHGKLHPWRFVHVPAERRPAFAALLRRAYRETHPDPARAEIEACDRFAYQAPTLLVVLSSPVRSAKIPVWEQELSCGAAIMNMLTAAHAMGFAAGWITGWAAFSPTVLRAFGSAEERIAGFLFVGTPVFPLEERPRPAIEEVATEWAPPLD